MKTWSPGAKTIPMVVVSNFERCSPVEPRKACNGAVELGPKPIKICPGDSKPDIHQGVSYLDITSFDFSDMFHDMKSCVISVKSSMIL